MCYFLYGAINDGANTADVAKALTNSHYRFPFGNAEAVNHCVETCGDNYRLTFRACDCDTAMGQGRTDSPQLKEFETLLHKLRDVRGIKHVFISKNWWKESNSRQETVHIDDIDLLSFLANMEESCLYKIQLYKRNYSSIRFPEQPGDCPMLRNQIGVKGKGDTAGPSYTPPHRMIHAISE